jgi:hypothetical protein
MLEQHCLAGLSESRRRAIFATLVHSQDQGAPVRQSRRLAAVSYDITLTDVLAIEREGLDHCWPPLHRAC